MNDDRVDELLDQARPDVLILVAAGFLAVEGALLMAAGLQGVLLLKVAGFWGWFPPAIGLTGIAMVLSAVGFGRVISPTGPLAVAVASLASALAVPWFLASIWGRMLLPVAFAAACMAPFALLVTALALPAWLRCSRARRTLIIELDSHVPRQGNSGVLVAAVAVVVLGGAGALVLQSLAGDDPLAVAVVLRGSVSEDSDRALISAFASELRDREIDGVGVPDSLPRDATLDEARAAGRSFGAAHTLLLDLDHESERLGILGGTELYAVTLQARLLTTAGDPGEVEASDRIEFAFEDVSAAAVVSRVTNAWAGALEPWAVDQLYRRERFAPVLAADVPASKLPQAKKLMKLKPQVEARREYVEGFEQYCADERERLDGLRSGEVGGVTCIGDPCVPWTALGFDAAGRALVQEGSRRPTFKIPRKSKPGWTERPETVYSIDLDQPAEPRTLMRSANFYDFGRLSPMQTHLSLETFGADGQEAIVTLDLATGEPTDVGVLLPRERTVWVKAAPGGRGSLAQLGEGPAVLLSQDQRIELPQLTRAYWVGGDEPLFLAQAPPEIGLFDAAGQERARRDFEHPVAGAWMAERLEVMAQLPQGCQLLELDPGTLRTLATHDLEICVRRPQRLPDGSFVGVAPVTQAGDSPGDNEVVVWNRKGPLVQLTSGTHEDSSVYASADGTRLLFNRRLEYWPGRYDTRVYRRQVCWLDL